MIELVEGLWVVSGGQLTHPWDASAYLITGDEPTLKIGSDLEAWERSLDYLLTLDFDALTFGHCPPKIWYNAKDRVREAKQQFGAYYSPWFKPFHLEFQY